MRKGAPIFPRIEVEKEEKTEKKTDQAAPARAEKDETKAEITIDEFAKIDLRVAQVLAAEKVEGADKLLRLTVKLGGEERQIVAGIAKYYSPAELIGKEIVVVANLKPVKLRGVLPRMLLAASQGDKLAVLTPDRSVGDGAQVR